ncbi:hypothetical protein BV22DRAFT_1040974 [Leucogyrophana mollusca]|uniref:Uncharacterized protein n=1 Tax=Leucogyrophana mollusca TaxID=85980 RepID=A0ACB8B107_9AGAM|nr:hypothetical protein BV22DRAFT_1040974 [Leucogyrophana mollusca]
MRAKFSALLLPAIFVLLTSAQLFPDPATYVLKDKFVGRDFLNGFNWETFDDPTHGRVNYVDKNTALQRGLTSASDTKFFMRADNKTMVAPGARGRDSVRITSYQAYGDGIYILDLSHMPEGCSTWPAWWSTSQQGPWPQGGEIDIIEGVNIGATNLASLHTTPGCSMPPYRLQAGTAVSASCDTSVNSNQGCGTSLRYGTYGTSFNVAGGGYFAMRRARDHGISVWYIKRDPFLLPDGPDPDFLISRIPDASFPTGNNCNYQDHFNDHNVIFDLTFCGDWAGSVWGTSSCANAAPTCTAFVDNNPSAFSNAYWEINSLKIYTPVGPPLITP